ncbi:envelope glycoprotein [Plecturocebus cupreus]
MHHLTAEAAALVASSGQSHSPTVMFIAMMAILSCHSAQAFPLPDSRVLWAYVPDPPFLRPVTWNDPAFPVYINDTSILGFPSSSHITPQVATYTYSAQAVAPPMCFYASKIWDHDFSANVYSPPSIPLSFSGPYCFDLGIHRLHTFSGPPDLFPGETIYSRDWILNYVGIRETYNFSSAQRFPLIEHHHCGPSNSSLDPSPTLAVLQKQAINYTLPSGFSLFDWSVPHPHGIALARYETPGGWSTPVYTTFSGKAYTSLWKLFISLFPTFVRAVYLIPLGILFILNLVLLLLMLLLLVMFPLPGLLASYSIYCENCILTNCIDSSLFPVHTLLLVHQPPYVMLPVNVSGPWYDEKALLVFQQVLVSVVATAATAAVSLAHSVQTATYVNHLAKNISVTMGTQMDIDKKMDEKLNALEQTVTILGDKLYNIQNRLALRCHADYKFICVTNTPYNDTKWQWPLVKAHLQGIWTHDNLSLDVFKLQQEIHAIDFSRLKPA